MRNTNLLNQSFTRRAALKTAAASLLFPTIIPSSALGQDGATAPSNRTTLGVIGFGPRCTAVLGAMLPEQDMRCLVVCDAQAARREAGKRAVDDRYGNTDCKTREDFREVLARKDIDAVLIATGDRWHALASMMAAEAGKDVYSEKPCGITIADCINLAAKMKRYARVFQAGTQRRSISNFQLAIDLAHSGKLGRVHTLHASVYRPRNLFDWLPEEPLPPKHEVDWDTWLGPAPWRPFNRRYIQGGWRGYYDFDSGATLLDWGAHTVDLCQWANKADHTMPLEYEPTPNAVLARYANGVKLVMGFLDTPFGDRPGWHQHLGTCPVRFEGDEGWVETGDSGGIEAHPASLKRELQRLRQMRHLAGTDPASHGRNFLDSIKSRRPTNANPDVMRNSHIACHAAALAWMLNRKLTIDPPTATFLNDQEANRLRSRAQRQPWVL